MINRTVQPTKAKAVVGLRLSRRFLFAAAAIAAFPLPLSQPALADTAADAPATIKRFSEALLIAMRAGQQTDFAQRFDALAATVDQVFDLPAVLAVSVGPHWINLLPDQQDRLLEVFRRYTVASYVASFNNYAGQTSTVSPDVHAAGSDQVIVQSCITPMSGDATAIDYVMKQTISGWKVVDVLLAGSISRVAVQRSDFRRDLSNGGSDALLASLRHKTSDLSGGALI